MSSTLEPAKLDIQARRSKDAMIITINGRPLYTEPLPLGRECEVTFETVQESAQ